LDIGGWLARRLQGILVSYYVYPFSILIKAITSLSGKSNHSREVHEMMVVKKSDSHSCKTKYNSVSFSDKNTASRPTLINTWLN